LEVTGFGWSLLLEQPTVKEQTISRAAKMSGPALLFQVCFSEAFLPQATERVSVLRSALMRVIVVASCRLAAQWRMHGAGQGLER
jgi:hypothetical protein